MQARKQLWMVLAIAGCTAANPLYAAETGAGATTGTSTTTSGESTTTSGDATTGPAGTTSGSTTTAIEPTTSHGSTTTGESSGESSTTGFGFCGDGQIDGGEACDDGADGDNDDGCTDLCLLPACGDGFQQASLGETCDLALDNDDSGACTTGCAAAACGDELVYTGVEQCDDGPANSDTGGCTTLCKAGVCGDGLVHAGVELCDLGADNSDLAACNEDCGTPACGDGIQSATEACDDGVVGGGDGCEDDCTPTYQVFPGINHTCALFTAGAVRCWGGNGGGALGLGNSLFLGDQPGELPTPIVDLGGVVMVDLVVAGDSTCTVSQAGAVSCWGYNFEGQLGQGHTADIGDGPGEMPPADTQVGEPVSRLGGGLGAFCAVTQTGAVRCWGRGEYGRPGLGSAANIGDMPGELPAGAADVGFTVAQVAVSETHACAVSTAGALRCWGSGAHGALGHGDTTTLGDDPGELPTGDVPVGGEVVQVALGRGFSCALLRTGNVRCWGNNGDGQLGHGDTQDLGDQAGELPTPDLALGGSVARISAGERHACARLQSGAVKCWGSNTGGALGIGNTTTIGDGPGEMPPAPVALGGPAIGLHTGGGFHNCAVLVGGAVRCWGYNALGQLGTGSTQHLGDDEAVDSVPAIPIQ